MLLMYGVTGDAARATRYFQQTLDTAAAAAAAIETGDEYILRLLEAEARRCLLIFLAFTGATGDVNNCRWALHQFNNISSESKRGRAAWKITGAEVHALCTACERAGDGESALEFLGLLDSHGIGAKLEFYAPALRACIEQQKKKKSSNGSRSGGGPNALQAALKIAAHLRSQALSVNPATLHLLEKALGGVLGGGSNEQEWLQMGGSAEHTHDQLTEDEILLFSSLAQSCIMGEFGGGGGSTCGLDTTMDGSVIDTSCSMPRLLPLGGSLHWAHEHMARHKKRSSVRKARQEVEEEVGDIVGEKVNASVMPISLSHSTTETEEGGEEEEEEEEVEVAVGNRVGKGEAAAKKQPTLINRSGVSVLVRDASLLAEKAVVLRGVGGVTISAPNLGSALASATESVGNAWRQKQHAAMPTTATEGGDPWDRSRELARDFLRSSTSAWTASRGGVTGAANATSQYPDGMPPRPYSESPFQVGFVNSDTRTSQNPKTPTLWAALVTGLYISPSQLKSLEDIAREESAEGRDLIRSILEREKNGESMGEGEEEKGEESGKFALARPCDDDMGEEEGEELGGGDGKSAIISRGRKRGGALLVGKRGALAYDGHKPFPFAATSVMRENQEGRESDLGVVMPTVEFSKKNYAKKAAARLWGGALEEEEEEEEGGEKYKMKPVGGQQLR